jgi:TRAP-type mannitol/chloroaromatic compound transport system substrate-binding protein
MRKIGIVVVVLGVALCVAMPALAQQLDLKKGVQAALGAGEVVKWKVQGFTPAGTLYHETLQRLAEEVKTVTGGRLVWEVFQAGALVPPFEGLKAVSDGVYDANFGYTGQWIGKIPVAPLFTAAPGGMNAFDMQMWLEHGGGKELHQEMYDKYGYNLKLLLCAPISMEIFMWSKKPLRKIEDWKGIKLRMMPVMGDILAANGLSVVFMPAGEIIPNLQRGVIDAAEYSIPAFDKTLGLWETAKYLHLPGVHQPASQLELIINKKSYEALPADLKVLLDAAVWKSRLREWLWMESENVKAMDFYKEKGIEIVQVDPETIKTMMKWANDYLDAMGAKDEFYGKVWKSQKAWGEKWYPYAKMFSLPH